MAVNLKRLPEQWIEPDWPAPPNVRAFVTTRTGGVSDGVYGEMNVGDHVGDDPRQVAQNRTLLRAYLPGEPRWLKQVHGNKVLQGDGHEYANNEADASVTTLKYDVLVVQTADCLPVLLCDAGGTVVGIAHAGWRGLCSGVIENTAAAMNQSGDALLAYLGPAIGPGEFEVGPEVRDEFVGHDGNAVRCFKEGSNGKWLADIYGLAKQRLHALGVKKIYGGDFCTVRERNRFYSYRRDRETGRMASLIWLE